MTRHRAGSALAIPSWAALGGLVVVVVALLGFFITGSPDRAEQAAATESSPTTAPAATPDPTPSASPEPEEVPRAFVEVYNNTRTSGLAAAGAETVQEAGWKVVGTDNWNGNIPSTTVYYPARLEEQAKLLAGSVGIERLRPSVDPMKNDRITVILTGRL